MKIIPSPSTPSMKLLATLLLGAAALASSRRDGAVVGDRAAARDEPRIAVRASAASLRRGLVINDGALESKKAGIERRILDVEGEEVPGEEVPGEEDSRSPAPVERRTTSTSTARATAVERRILDDGGDGPAPGRPRERFLRRQGRNRPSEGASATLLSDEPSGSENRAADDLGDPNKEKAYGKFVANRDPSEDEADLISSLKAEDTNQAPVQRRVNILDGPFEVPNPPYYSSTTTDATFPSSSTSYASSTTTDATFSSSTSTIAVEETTNPTAKPTDSPTTLPKFVTVIPGVVSVNQKICTFDSVQQAFWISGFEAVVKNLIMASSVTAANSENVRVYLTNMCGRETASVTEFLQSTSSSQNRKLQEVQGSTWDILYHIVVENISCAQNGCTDDADKDLINNIITAVETVMDNTVQTGDFATLLASNSDIISAFGNDSESIGCLVAWGTVYSATWGGHNTANAVQVKEVTGKDDLNITNQNLFYPDWKGNSGTCRNDGQEEGYMRNSPQNWMYTSLASCCARYYSGWNEPRCLQYKGTGLWYVNYLFDAQRCVTDCEVNDERSVCGGLAPPNTEQLYDRPRECCEQHLPWIFIEWCESQSYKNECYAGTRKFYRGDKVCVRDCDPDSGDKSCGGIIKQSWPVLYGDDNNPTYDDASACCSEKVDWVAHDLCVARSNAATLDKYWPDQSGQEGAGRCYKDSEKPTEDLSVPIFNTVEECCTEGIWWKGVDACVAASGGTNGTEAALQAAGSGKYYIDWKLDKCVKDCEKGHSSGCGGLAQSWHTLYDSSSICCDMIGSWVERKNCVLK